MKIGIGVFTYGNENLSATCGHLGFSVTAPIWVKMPLQQLSLNQKEDDLV